MNENEYISEVLLPSLQKAAEKIEGITGAEPTGDELGLPAVLLHTEDGNYVISCIPASDETDVLLYRVKQPWYDAWEFLAIELPEDLEVFPYLIRIYDVLRGFRSEKISFEGGGDEENKMLKRSFDVLTRAFEETRLPALSAVLSQLEIETVISRAEDGSSRLAMLEEQEPVLFSYIDVLPDESICLLKVEWDGNEIFIPEAGGVKEPSVYEKLLDNLYCVSMTQ